MGAEQGLWKTQKKILNPKDKKSNNQVLGKQYKGILNSQ